MTNLDSINWHFIAHVIRDVFGKPITPAVITDDTASMDNFRSPVHSLGFTQYYFDKLNGSKIQEVGNQYVEWHPDRPPQWANFHDLILIHKYYSYKFYDFPKALVAFNIRQMSKPGAPIILSSCPSLDSLPLPINWEKTFELQQYPSVFEKGKVTVYENL